MNNANIPPTGPAAAAAVPNLCTRAAIPPPVEQQRSSVWGRSIQQETTDFVTPNVLDDKEHWNAPEQIYGGMTKNMERYGTMWNINLVSRTIEKRTTALTIN